MQLIEALKAVHESGFVYNDLKLDNIMINRKNDRQNEYDFNLVLIDYGLAIEYRSDSGKHLPMEEMPEFKGNLIFASEHALCFKRPSRRDDLLSVCYLLIYLLNECDFPLLNEYFSDKSKSYNIEEVRRFKKHCPFLRLLENVALQP